MSTARRLTGEAPGELAVLTPVEIVICLILGAAIVAAAECFKR